MQWVEGTTSEGQEIFRRKKAADAPFLSGGFWEEGRVVVCEVVSVHKSSNGPYIAVELIEPALLELPDKEGQSWEHSVVRIGNLMGFSAAREAALEEQKNKYFVPGDKLEITCTGITPPTQEGYSPSPNFKIRVGLNEAARKAGAPF